MREDETPEYFVFVGQGHLQDVGSSWNASHDLQYSIYKIPAKANLKDAMLFGYVALVGQEYAFSEKCGKLRNRWYDIHHDRSEHLAVGGSKPEPGKCSEVMDLEKNNSDCSYNISCF